MDYSFNISDLCSIKKGKKKKFNIAKWRHKSMQ